MIDPENPVAKLCAQGIEREGLNPRQAQNLYFEAWEAAANDLEKAIAAHYVARMQNSVAGKLAWDEKALAHALKAPDEATDFLPSLYLNNAKGYEDLGATDRAIAAYRAAGIHAQQLPDDGYGNLIRSGIKNGIDRLTS